MCAQTSGEVVSGGSCKGNVGVEMSKILKRVLRGTGGDGRMCLRRTIRNGLDDVIVRVENIDELVTVKNIPLLQK